MFQVSFTQIIGFALSRYKNLTDLSNKFYTLSKHPTSPSSNGRLMCIMYCALPVPHNFGMQLPPVVESLKMLQEKIHLLEVRVHFARLSRAFSHTFSRWLIVVSHEFSMLDHCRVYRTCSVPTGS